MCKYKCHTRGSHSWWYMWLTQISQWLSSQTATCNIRSLWLDEQSSKNPSPHPTQHTRSAELKATMQVWNIQWEVTFKTKASWGAGTPPPKEIRASNWSHSTHRTRGSQSHQGRCQGPGMMTGTWRAEVDLPRTCPFKCCPLHLRKRWAHERKGVSQHLK